MKVADMKRDAVEKLDDKKNLIMSIIATELSEDIDFMRKVNQITFSFILENQKRDKEMDVNHPRSMEVED